METKPGFRFENLTYDFQSYHCCMECSKSLIFIQDNIVYDNDTIYYWTILCNPSVNNKFLYILNRNYIQKTLTQDLLKRKTINQLKEICKCYGYNIGKGKKQDIIDLLLKPNPIETDITFRDIINTL